MVGLLEEEYKVLRLSVKLSRNVYLIQNAVELLEWGMAKMYELRSGSEYMPGTIKVRSWLCPNLWLYFYANTRYIYDIVS